MRLEEDTDGRNGLYQAKTEEVEEAHRIGATALQIK
jgi:hypothetical protein